MNRSGENSVKSSVNSVKLYGNVVKSYGICVKSSVLVKIDTFSILFTQVMKLI